MISAVLDTNILASGTVTAATPPGQILERWLDRQFELVISEHIIDELERTLNKSYFQKHLTPNAIKAFIGLLQSKATMISITIKVKGIATHIEDDLVIAAAVSGKVDYLVTGDGPLIRKVDSYKGVRLISPNDFLEVLKKQT